MFFFYLEISRMATCSNITSLSGLFGAITASAVVGIFLSLAGIVIVLKSLSWKSRHYLVVSNGLEIDCLHSLTHFRHKPRQLILEYDLH